jgi:hypothetical protein
VLAFTQVALAASRQEHMAKTLAGCKNFMRDPKNAHPKQKHANGSKDKMPLAEFQLAVLDNEHSKPLAIR